MEEIINNLNNLKLSNTELLTLEEYNNLNLNLKVKDFGEVYTPFELVDEMLDKLPAEIWKNKFYTFFEPVAGLSPFILKCYKKLMEGLKEEIPDEEERKRWIIENMLYMNELQPKNITLLKKIYQADTLKSYKVNIFEGDFLSLNINQKFSVILGNPPYNKDTSKVGKSNGNAIWQDFVKKSLTLLVENGFMLMIHPPMWRKPPNERSKSKGLWNLLTRENQMIYLEIHNLNDGKKIFKCNTKFDWYIIQKCNSSYETLFKDEKGIYSYFNSNSTDWLPNYNYEKIKFFIEGQEKCNIIYNRSSYSDDRNWISREPKEGYPYIIIHTTSKQGIRYLYSSRNDNGHFGIAKVIFGDSGAYNPVLDFEGNYGMSAHSMALQISLKEEGEEICKVLQSDEFVDIIKSCIWSSFGIDWNLFKYFRKDFYKYIDTSLKIKKIEEIKDKNEIVLNETVLNEENKDLDKITKNKILGIKTVKELAELLKKHEIIGRSKLKKDNMSKFKNKLIEKLKL